MGQPGRPRKIETPEEMDRLVDEYVEDCDLNAKPLTLTGMILHLGLSSRESFDTYKTYDGFSDSVKRAKLIIENQYETALHANATAGPIFALKNFGWSDKQEHEHSGPGGGAITFTTVYETKDGD